MFRSLKRQNIYPRRKKNELVIKTAFKPRGPNLPSKRPFGTIYQVAKAGLQLSGYYDKYDLRRFDPDYLYKKHVERYTYKPGKRAIGYALQTKGFLRKKKSSRYRKFYYQSIQQRFWCYRHNGFCSHSKSSKFPSLYSPNGRESGVSYQSNIRYD